jgi:hypothetical protein
VRVSKRSGASQSSWSGSPSIGTPSRSSERDSATRRAARGPARRRRSAGGRRCRRASAAADDRPEVKRRPGRGERVAARHAGRTGDHRDRRAGHALARRREDRRAWLVRAQEPRHVGRAVVGLRGGVAVRVEAVEPRVQPGVVELRLDVDDDARVVPRSPGEPAEEQERVVTAEVLVQVEPRARGERGDRAQDQRGARPGNTPGKTIDRRLGRVGVMTGSVAMVSRSRPRAHRRLRTSARRFRNLPRGPDYSLGSVPVSARRRLPRAGRSL